jgi:protein phosphatase
MSDRTKDTADHFPEPHFGDWFFAPFDVSVRYEFGAASHIGNVRPHNEDHFAVFQMRRARQLLLSSLPPEELPMPDTCAYAMVVADGMGGMRSGEVASRLALQTMVELSGQATSWIMRLTNLDAQQVAQRVQAYIERIHATITTTGRSNPALQNMGTTWTSAHLLGSNAIIVHLGDSRAYLFRDGNLIQITHDETMAQKLIDAGMEPESVNKFKHVLINSFGGGNDRVRAAFACHNSTSSMRRADPASSSKRRQG